MNKACLGRAAEELAARFLESEGWRIVCRNYRTRCGEIDLICLDRAVVSFVEVRSKNTPGFGTAAESVTARKRAGISRVALQFLKEKGWLERTARFDVVCVDGRGETTGVRLIKAAFELGG